MRWPWRAEPDHARARAAQAEASAFLADARRQAPKVTEVMRVVRQLARQADDLSHDVERALRGL